MAEETKKVLSIFYCYAYEDKTLLDELDKRLKPFQRRGEITIWSNREIRAGKEWAQEIDQNLDMADIILLLVSPDLIASEYIYSKEIGRALVRHAEGKARVIPIILRIGDYENERFSQLQSLPSNQKPITHWHSQDDAWFNVTEGIKKAIQDIRANNETLFQTGISSKLDQGRNSRQEIDSGELIQQQNTNYEVISPTIERLLSSLSPV